MKEIHSSEKFELERYKLAVEGSTDALWDRPDINIDKEWWSPKFYEMLGYKKGEIEPSFETFRPHVHPDFLTLFSSLHESHLQGNVKNDIEYKLRRKDGKYIWVRERFKLYRRSDGRLRLSGSLQDITEKKRIEQSLRESEKRYRTIFENSLLSLSEQDISRIRNMIRDLKERKITDFERYFRENPEFVEQAIKSIQVVNVNEATRKYFGAGTKEELLGPLSHILNTAKYREIFCEELTAIAEGKDHYIGERSFFIRSEQRHFLIHSTIPMLNDPNQIMLVSITDITEQKKAEKKIQHSLEERELLIKELHHRVKNNLNMIASMLNLQGASISDEQQKKIFYQISNKIRTISLVYEKLYSSNDLQTVHLPTYIKDLIEMLKESNLADSSNLTVDLSVKDILLDMKSVIPAALIMCELFSNSCKYAFPSKEKGFIKIEITKEKNFMIIGYSDNGNGMPGNIDLKNPQTFGLILIQSLLLNLKGSIQFADADRSGYIVRFPIDSGASE